MSDHQSTLAVLLNRAWQWREELGMFEISNALRVFHGPGDSWAQTTADPSERSIWSDFSVDRFGDHYWITHKENHSTQGARKMSHKESQSSIRGEQRILKIQSEMIDFFREKGAVSVVGLSRPVDGVPNTSAVLWGRAPQERIQVREGGCEFWIQLTGTRHPGLFLDHFPLRQWLMKNCSGKRVLNTFAYTGSLSIAAAKGGAEFVTTLDLGRPFLQWAKDNWLLNQLPEEKSRFIAGDVFEWLPRLKRQNEKFDCIILDPPSFSHGKAGRFSTQKDLQRLHAMAMDLLPVGGLLITSLNSANMSWEKYSLDVQAAARSKKMIFLQTYQMDLPETFPTRLGDQAGRYLKGWILKRSS